MEQVALLLGLSYILNMRSKLPTRSTGTKSSCRKVSAGKPKRGQSSTAGRLSALGKRVLREKEASKQLSTMKKRLLPKESFAICSKSWTRNCKLDLLQGYIEVKNE